MFCTKSILDGTVYNYCKLTTINIQVVFSNTYVRIGR